MYSFFLDSLIDSDHLWPTNEKGIKMMMPSNLSLRTSSKSDSFLGEAPKVFFVEAFQSFFSGGFPKFFRGVFPKFFLLEASQFFFSGGFPFLINSVAGRFDPGSDVSSHLETVASAV